MLPTVPPDAPHADEHRELLTRAARAEGRRIGTDPDSWAGQCPFGHKPELEFAQRTAWLRGFGEGRAHANGRPAATSAHPTHSETQHALRTGADMARARGMAFKEGDPTDRTRSAVSAAMLSLANDLELLADRADLGGRITTPDRTSRG